MKKYSLINYNGELGNFLYKLSFKGSPKMYLGITNNPKRRILQHIHAWNHKKSKDYYSSKWIKKYIDIGDILVMEILHNLPTYQEAQKKELELIAQYREAGFELVNLADGGEGTPGRVISQETREKIANSLRGKKHTEERRRNISEGHKGQVAWNKGKEPLPHVIEAMRAGTRNRSPERTQEIHDRYRDLYSKEYILVSPSGEIIQVKNLKQFSKENDLSYCSMNKVANGKIDFHRGYSSPFSQKSHSSHECS